MLVSLLGSGALKRNESLRLILALTMGIFIGIIFQQPRLLSNFGRQTTLINPEITPQTRPPCTVERHLNATFVRPGTESLPPAIVSPHTDLFPRRLWGNPSEDLHYRPKYLLTVTVGVKQKEMVNKAVSKFNLTDWTLLLFHYDGNVDAWDEFEWSQQAIHISVKKQTKWWYAKRFLHPDVVEPFEYIFIWDEDLEVDHFEAHAYIGLLKKYGLEISQPGLEPDRGLTWEMTKRRGDVEVHKQAQEKPGWCVDGPLKPPCAAFVEIMAPVFSRKAWRCVWHLIQNDLVHGWGLDFSLQLCAEPGHEKIGVVDTQWIRHKGVPSLGEQGQAVEGRQAWEGVRERCRLEWKLFAERLKKAQQLANTTRS